MKHTQFFFGGLLLAFSLSFTSCTDDSLGALDGLDKVESVPTQEYVAADQSATVRNGSDSEPTFYPKWKSGSAAYECNQANSSCAYSWKVDANAPNGTYYTNTERYGNVATEVDAEITISNSNHYTFDWSSDHKVYSVIVKAGRSAYVYSYPGGSYGDKQVSTPINPKNDKMYEISHVSFCFGDQIASPEDDNSGSNDF